MHIECNYFIEFTPHVTLTRLSRRSFQNLGGRDTL